MQRHKKGSLESQARAEQLKNTLGRAFNQWSAAQGGTTGNHGQQGFGTAMAALSPDPRSTGGNNNNFDPASPDKFDQLDDQEAFDKLEIERVLANDPESLAFFNAQKTRRANITQNGGTLRRIQQNKRFT
jgi:hypothetical protein